MKCPIDNMDLVMSSRAGVEIDYCPQCRGVWLDRGELDKIIERTIPPMTQAEPQVQEPPKRAPLEPREFREPYKRGERAEVYREPYRDDRRDDRDDYRKEKRRKRRKSFLEEIFDFD